MAQKHVLQILIDVNGKAAKGDIRSIVDLIKKELNQSFQIKLDFPNSKSVSNRLSRLTRRLQTFNSELERLARTANPAAVGMANIAAASGVATQSFKELRISSSQATKVIQGNATVVNQGASAMERLGAQTALTARRYAGFVVASRFLFGFERALEDAISNAIEFNTQLVKVAQVTNLPIAAMAGLKQEIFSLGAAFAVPIEDLNQAARTLSQAGFSLGQTRNILKSLAPTNLAATFGDMSETVDGLIAILNQFNIEADKTATIFDTLNVLAAKYPAEVQDIIEITKRAGSVFASASGVKDGLKAPIDAFQELAAVGTAVRSTTRLTAEQIGTSLKTIFSRVQSPQILEDLRNLGVELTTVDNKFVGPIEALKRLDQRLQGVSENSVLFAKIANTIGGLRQIDKTIALLTNLELVMEALGDAQSDANVGSVLTDAQKALLDLGTQFKSLQQSFRGLIDSIISSSVFQSLGSGLITGAQRLIEAGKILQPLIPVFGAIAGVKGAIGLFKFVKGFYDNIKFLNVNTQALNRNTSAILSMNRGIGFTPLFPTKVPKRATGGPVRGPGGSRSDSILTAISNGEYVISADAVKKVGLPFLNAVNKGMIPKLARGGLPGGGTTAGKLKDVLKAALSSKNTDFSRADLVSQARKGAEAFGINPDAIEKAIITQLKDGIDPKQIRSGIREMFVAIRKFIDQERLGSTRPIATPSGPILGGAAPAFLPNSPVALSRDPRLPILNKNAPVPNPQLIDPNKLVALPGPPKLLGLPAPTEADNVADRARKLREQAKKDLEYIREKNNPPIVVGPGGPGSLRGGGGAPPFVPPTNPDEVRKQFVDRLSRFGNDKVANQIFDKIQKKASNVTQLAKLADERVSKIYSKAGLTSIQPDITGDTQFAGQSAAFNKFNKLKDRLVQRGLSEQEATRRAGLAIGRTPAYQRFGAKAGRLTKLGGNLARRFGGGVSKFAAGGGALAASLALDFIPTSETSKANVVKGGLGGALSGAALGSAFSPVGAIIGGLGGAAIGAISSFNLLKSSLSTKEIDGFRQALVNAKTDVDKSKGFAGILGSALTQSRSGFTLSELPFIGGRFGGRKAKAGEAFGNVQGDIDNLAAFIAQAATKSGKGSLAQFLDELPPELSALRSAVFDVDKLSRAAGVKNTLPDSVNKQIRKNEEFKLQEFTTRLSEVMNNVLVRELQYLSEAINVANSSINSFSDETSRITREGLGEFGGPFRKVDIGTGTTAEIYKALPGVEFSALGGLLEGRDVVKDELNGILLKNAFGGGSIEGAIDQLTSRAGIPATLRNTLKQQKKDLLAGREDLTEAEKFSKLEGVLTDFINNPAFDAARQVVQDYVNLLNRQNEAIQQSIESTIQLANAQRQNLADAQGIRAGARDFRSRFTQRFPDTKGAITNARFDSLAKFRTLFPNVDPNAGAVGIGAAISQERANLEALKANPQGNAFAIRASQDKLGQLTNALKFLRDSVDELSAIENRLVEINQNRENAVNFARRIATADPSELASINAQIANIKRFEAGGSLTAQQTGSALDLIDQLLGLDDNVLKQFGRSREELDALREKIIASGARRAADAGIEPILGAFANGPGKDKESQDRLKRADEINKERAEAANKLGKIAAQRIGEIDTLLNRQLEQFQNQAALFEKQLQNINRLEVISERLTQIPTEIIMKVDLGVNVNLNNADLLKRLDTTIRKIVEEQIKATIIRPNPDGIVNGN